jgi:hypothetical protein
MQVKVKHKLQHKYSQVQGEISFLHNTKTCSTCAQNIDPDFMIKLLRKNNSICQMSEAIILTEVKIQKLQDQLRL